MKKMTILCVISAVLGALLAIALYDPPSTMPTTAAQESGHWSPPLIDTHPPAEDGPESTPQPQDHQGLTTEERVNVSVYKNANRSAINISTRTVETDLFFMRELTSQGEGSGTVIDQKGHILTNFHVIDSAREIQVTLYNGKTFPARLVGADPATDLAVLKIDAPAESLHPVTFGSSTGLKVGQRVFAIGNPFGLERTLSTGIISSLNRSLPRRNRRGTIKSIIQIDAAINPGNSGGPLLDSHGRLIGLNTAIASKTGESAGVGFAIPVNTILRIVPQLIRDGRIVRAEIGIVRVYETERGLLIYALTPGGPAHQAGLQGPKVIRRKKRQGPFIYEYRTIDRSAADLIVAIDDKPVRTADELLTIIESKAPGDEVVVTVIRDGKQKRITVRLEAEE
jgi:S1-C subfamily serine protease